MPERVGDRRSDGVARRRIDKAGRELRRAIDAAVRPTAAILETAAELSAGYRAERPLPLTDDRRAAAYAAARMPATFAAMGVALASAAEVLPAFRPRSLLDVGAGTGAASWAALAVWPSIGSVALIERERAAVDLGRRLAREIGWQWQISDLAAPPVSRSVPTSVAKADLVLAGYVLGELAPADRRTVVERLWAGTTGAIVVAEPGSRAGFGTILEARSALIEAGATIVAPCPGDGPCPVAGSRRSWCHFLARHDRSPLERRAKAGVRSWEDEPYAYVVAARPALLADPRPRVVLGRPRHRPGIVELRICDDGRIETVVVSRRQGHAYRAATDLTWGDAVRVPFRFEG